MGSHADVLEVLTGFGKMTCAYRAIHMCPHLAGRDLKVVQKALVFGGCLGGELDWLVHKGSSFLGTFGLAQHLFCFPIVHDMCIYVYCIHIYIYKEFLFMIRGSQFIAAAGWARVLQGFCRLLARFEQGWNAAEEPFSQHEPGSCCCGTPWVLTFHVQGSGYLN